MCSQREWFEELKPSSGTVSCAAKSSLLEVAGTGVIRGRLKNGQEIVLTNVLFILKLNGNLILVKQIQKAGYSVLFRDNKDIVKAKNKTFILCELNSKGQYVSDFIPTVSNIFVAEMEETETDIKLEETERAIDDQYPEFIRSQRERKPPVRYPFNEALSATNEELT
ncbi:hypothetical protein AVEN_218562-1 [Araneus ventricosus]|uniref:Retrovirus-related Pol polyprotein from transposon TNT 1-94-like beta-barrel domain-containing protein n=1 Tax=Araneus ventricosus TaxID=182803 RepID=A0A4Y2N669_ARAVE|nr:hypothetical protein AVEN_218562-1 [Araneus ventricosus]